jgi:hypothetical protein
VALAAKAVGFLERDQLPTGEMQPVPVLGVVAIEAPPVLLVVAEDDLPVERQVPTGGIGRHHPVAHGAGIDAGREGRRGDLQPLLRFRPILERLRHGHGHGLVPFRGTPGKEKGNREEEEGRGDAEILMMAVPQLSHSASPPLAAPA